jgi:hypothetical protein
VVSDLIRGRPIWLGGEDRKEASDTFIYWFRPKMYPEDYPGWRNSRDIQCRGAGFFD